MYCSLYDDVRLFVAKFLVDVLPVAMMEIWVGPSTVMGEWRQSIL
jgi:hypothetical protein